MPHEYTSYKDLTATPEKHLDFLRVVDSHINTGGADYYNGLKADVKVNGEAFSQARHLTVLESQSDGWDFEETPEGVKSEIAYLSEKIKAADAGYDLPHFTTGYQWMLSQLKEPPAPPPPAAPRHDTTKNQAAIHDAATRNTKENLGILQANPAMSGKSAGELEKLAFRRGVIADFFKAKPLAEQSAALARFDKSAVNSDFLKKIDQQTTTDLEESKKPSHSSQKTRENEGHSL